MSAVFKSTSKPASANLLVEKAAGEAIFNEGDLGTEMYILHSGEVEIVRNLDGREVELAVLERGDFFGEMSLLEELPRAATARARSDVKLLQISGATFDQMLRDNPEIAVRMMRKLSRRLRQTDRMLEEGVTRREAQAAAVGIPEREDGDRTVGPEVLVHPRSGMEFHLSAGPETTLGRLDPVTNIYPDVDLTPVDGQRSISRRHAKVYRRGDKFFVAEDLGTMNGTYLNDERLETGVPRELHDGDDVRVGLVELQFRLEAAD